MSLKSRITALEEGEEVLLNTRVNATTSGTGAQTLHTYNLPAGKLVNVGDKVRVRHWWHTAANANSKAVAPEIGGQWAGGASTTSSGASVRSDIEVQKTGTDTQRYWTYSDVNAGAGSTGQSTYTLDDGATIPFVAKATTSVQAGDITLDHVLITYIPAKDS